MFECRRRALTIDHGIDLAFLSKNLTMVFTAEERRDIGGYVAGHQIALQKAAAAMDEEDDDADPPPTLGVAPVAVGADDDDMFQ